MSKHGETERSLIKLFVDAKEFVFEKNKYQITDIGKPKPSQGESKTDIYIKTKNISTKEVREFKISVKQNDADFLENKLTLPRAKAIFGEDAKAIMVNSINSVEKDFVKEPLINFNKIGRTEEKSIKIGWRFELLNKDSGNRSGLLVLDQKQKIDIYSGSNLSESKKNASVNGIKVANSGVANFILNVDNTHNKLEHYLKGLKPIETFAAQQDVYFAAKAINYRSNSDKWDGNRALSVAVDWRLEDNKLKANLIMDKPLEIKANQIGENIKNILNKLNVNSENFNKLKDHLDKNVITDTNINSIKKPDVNLKIQELKESNSKDYLVDNKAEKQNVLNSEMKISGIVDDVRVLGYNPVNNTTYIGKVNKNDSIDWQTKPDYLASLSPEKREKVIKKFENDDFRLANITAVGRIEGGNMLFAAEKPDKNIVLTANQKDWVGANSQLGKALLNLTSGLDITNVKSIMTNDQSNQDIEKTPKNEKSLSR